MRPLCRLGSCPELQCACPVKHTLTHPPTRWKEGGKEESQSVSQGLSEFQEVIARGIRGLIDSAQSVSSESGLLSCRVPIADMPKLHLYLSSCGQTVAYREHSMHIARQVGVRRDGESHERVDGMQEGARELASCRLEKI